MIGAAERKVLRPRDVAEKLASINDAISQREPTVGENCIVIWRYGRTGVHGSGHSVFEGTNRTKNTPVLPTISQGTDIRALLGAMFPFFVEMAPGTAPSFPEIDNDAINAELAKLPDKPDETLR